MPQMAPLNWLMLNIYFLLIFLILITIIHWIPIFKIKFNMKFKKKKIFQFMW